MLINVQNGPLRTNKAVFLKESQTYIMTNRVN
jgi:hypothetical protein